jgi:hypothetical protein
MSMRTTIATSPPTPTDRREMLNTSSSESASTVVATTVTSTATATGAASKEASKPPATATTR